MDIESTSPLKLFEYLAASRPIVTTDIPAIARVVEHEENGLLATPNDIDDLTKCVRRAMEDEHLSNKLEENALRTAEKYSWKERCEKMLELAGFPP